MFAAIDWNYWHVGGAIVVLLVGIYVPSLKPILGKVLGGLGSAAPETKPTTQATDPVGQLAEKFASVRNHCEAVNDTEAVKALDSVAPCLFHCPHKDA